MSKSIKLSPKHGVNPTIPICCWCGKEKNEIALMGKIDRNDSEAPKHIILDYEPCDTCRAAFEKGVTFVEVTSEADKINPNLVPISYDDKKNPTYPTFNVAVVKTEAARKIIPSADFKDGDRCCLYVPDFMRILGIKGVKANNTSEDTSGTDAQPDEN